MFISLKFDFMFTTHFNTLILKVGNANIFSIDNTSTYLLKTLTIYMLFY